MVVLILIGCGGAPTDNRTDDEKIRDEVRNYLFLDDSVAVAAQVVDTILVADLDGMLATIEDNLEKVQLDIDTLNTMIDGLSYGNKTEEEVLAIESDKLLDSQYKRDIKLLKYKLKMSELQSTKMGFQQSKRVMLHLRRSQLNTVAGYEIKASYNNGGEDVELAFIMTADFRIID